MRLQDVMSGIENIQILGDSAVNVASLKYDSRRVLEGDMFAAVQGEKQDGMNFIEDAARRGATTFLVPEGTKKGPEGTFVTASNVRKTLALASRNFFGDPSSRLKVVGITGTNGKTTSSYLVHGILEQAGIDSGLIGTVQYLVGGEVLSAARTTPESPDLFGLMERMVQKGCGACIMEVSSHALVLDRVTGVTLEVAVFMNLTRDHLDFHKDMEAYFRAKATLFESGEVNHKVVNRDDPFGMRLIQELGGDVLTFGMHEGDISPEGDVKVKAWGSSCRLKTPWGPVDVNTALPGRFNLYNIMAAVASCGLLGLDTDTITRGLSSVKRVPGRFESVDRGQPFSAVVDYAHTPDAVQNILENARAITVGRVITVLGCGGDRDTSKRPLMGHTAGRLSDILFVTSDNPRSEDPESIIDDIMEGIDGPSGTVERITDRRTAIDRAVREAKPGDMVVVAGKGHENYQIIGERILPFSDVDELARAIEKVMGEKL
ncbi:MAG: UDP-N-acetylmuramoyl-L-alanyl-D-glutamate--2,6-diaminopimelate ligase [bacterium]|nr:UDP-N-acetylmuramoyl-L-alanyl-D-glutamate--2,6-diaminopimelate ligase [bacterium]MDT8365033.1 UDP-N-acetylmuramoyl-L-alanyl-D-glutamate--2,6-diaminopimelate ligase [bacterium]